MQTPQTPSSPHGLVGVSDWSCYNSPMNRGEDKSSARIDLTDRSAGDTAHGVEKDEQNDSILGLEIKERGLVWCGLDVLTIQWDVETVPVDEHGSTAKISGYSLEYKDGGRQFVPSYRVVRIIKAASTSPDHSPAH